MSETPNRNPQPSVGAALILYVAVLGLNVATGLAINALDWPLNIALVVSPGVLLAVTLIAAVVARVNFRETFNLRAPKLTDALLAIPLAFSFVVINEQLSSLTQAVFPLPEELIENLTNVIRASTRADWWWRFAGVAVGATVSEELLFRGYILTGLRRNMSRRASIMWSAFLFTMLHIIPFPTYFLAGCVLAVVTLATKSIWVPMIIHFINNLAALALVNFTELESLGEPVWLPPGILVPATLIFGLTLGYFLREIAAEIPEKQSSEPEPIPPSEPLRLPAPPPLSEELAGISQEKRTLGWILVIVASLAGLVVLFGLFSYSVYVSFPQERHAVLIDYLREETKKNLDAETKTREPEIDGAYDQLLSANEDGRIRFWPLSRVVFSYAEGAADKSISSADLDNLLATIESVLSEGEVEHL